MKKSQLTTYDTPDVTNIPIPSYSSSSYKLGEEVANGFRWWGQVQFKKNKYTALFICPKCKDIFRTQISKVLTSITTSCGCK